MEVGRLLACAVSMQACRVYSVVLARERHRILHLRLVSTHVVVQLMVLSKL